jgi:hypothetical protein
VIRGVNLEHPVNEVELQLSGLKFSEDVKTTLNLADDIPPVQCQSTRG